MYHALQVTDGTILLLQLCLHAFVLFLDVLVETFEIHQMFLQLPKLGFSR